MKDVIRTFEDMPAELQFYAGGKGGVLARLYQSGYPVPNGFIIMPPAFAEDLLTPAAWTRIHDQLERMRNGDGRTSFAVRSSALSEDSAQASFAGEFETVLDVHSDEMIREAIQTVRRSRKSERVQAYSKAKGMEFAHEIAVVVQQLVRAEISGILFTADPVSGSRLRMNGNFIHGLGDELVSGEADPYAFTFERPSGKYQGPPDIRPYARRLYKMAIRLEKELGCTQDIEWAIAGGKLYLLQSRPITTMVEYDPATGEWNSSHSGDYLWMANEVLPDVMSPSSISLWQSFHAVELASTRGMGIIGGRIYLNFSLIYHLMHAFGKSEADVIEYIELVGGGSIPKDLRVPGVAMTRWTLVKEMLPTMWRLLPRQFRLKRKFKSIVDSIPGRCRELRARIQDADGKSELSALWDQEIFPLFDDLLLIQDGLNEDYFYPFIALKKELTNLMGQIEANDLLSTVASSSGDLASMGSLVGLAKVARGEMSRQAYEELVGHRPQRENELMARRPYEDPDWIDRQLADFADSPIDVDAMLAKRSHQFEDTWRKFEIDFPKKSQKIRKKIERIATAIKNREHVRCELTRMIATVRAWFLRAGEMSGLGQDVFYLTYPEMLQVLSGDETPVTTITARKETYESLRRLPTLPMIINGRFDPEQWAADPNRRSDVFDSHAPVPMPDSDTVNGFPGSAGRAEGIIRFLSGPEEGCQLQHGEILLASTTNVGWTPVFPRASAVITDIGAPLSHAAIVARELGIPAVVGCGNATMRLKSGDRVKVDGSRGTVEILEHA